jgi:hypothetical protein
MGVQSLIRTWPFVLLNKLVCKGDNDNYYNDYNVYAVYDNVVDVIWQHI